MKKSEIENFDDFKIFCENKKNRLQTYKRVLKLLNKTEKPMAICEIISMDFELMITDISENMEFLFPELYVIKPKRRRLTGYWWPVENTNIRIKKIQEIIKKMEKQS